MAGGPEEGRIHLSPADHRCELGSCNGRLNLGLEGAAQWATSVRLRAGSIEEKIFQRQLAKEGLSRVVVDDNVDEQRTFSR